MILRGVSRSLIFAPPGLKIVQYGAKVLGGVLEEIKDIEQRLPFPILGFDSDNGDEFLNWHLFRYFTEHEQNPVIFTRSRPYHSDDNAHVEQKNWTHVRQLFGYWRIENQAVIELMNDLYRNECSLLRNYFLSHHQAQR